MLKNSLHWRRQHHVDTILETWNPPDTLLEYYPGGWHHFDKGRSLISQSAFTCLKSSVEVPE